MAMAAGGENILHVRDLTDGLANKVSLGWNLILGTAGSYDISGRTRSLSIDRVRSDLKCLKNQEPVLKT